MSKNEVPEVPAPVYMAHTPRPIPPVSFHKTPLIITCPYCYQTAHTITSPAFGVLSCMTMMFGCIGWILAGCTNITRDTEHRCGVCKTYVGTYKR